MDGWWFVVAMQMCRTVARVAKCAAPTMYRKCAREEFARELAFLRGSTATTTSKSMVVSMMEEVIQVRLSLVADDVDE